MPADNTGILVGYLAGRFPGRVGHLFSPRPGRVPCGPFSFMPYALDNGIFAAGENWDESKWLEFLAWAKLSGHRPLWLLVPDVVGDSIRTVRRWEIYKDRAAAFGWPLAFAVQDGMVRADVPSDAQVIFVGGSTEWKWRTMAEWCGWFPRVHVGRVNSWRRLWQCEDAGAESVDGTGWTRGNSQDRRKYPALLDYLEKSTNGGRVRQMELIV